MKIVEIIWEEWHVEHITDKHNVGPWEVEEACFEDENNIVLKGKGGRRGRLYYILGKTTGGRHLHIVVKSLEKGKAKVITARNMSEAEKRRYKEVK